MRTCWQAQQPLRLVHHEHKIELVLGAADVHQLRRRVGVLLRPGCKHHRPVQAGICNDVVVALEGLVVPAHAQKQLRGRQGAWAGACCAPEWWRTMAPGPYRCPCGCGARTGPPARPARAGSTAGRRKRLCGSPRCLRRQCWQRLPAALGTLSPTPDQHHRVLCSPSWPTCRVQSSRQAVHAALAALP